MKQIKARRIAQPAKAELNARNLTLAALGVAAIARRESRGLLNRAETRGRRFAERVQLEAGAASTIQDIAAAEKVSDRFVSRMMRLAYLSPEVLEHLVIRRVPPALSLNDLVSVADRPWAEQMGIVFEGLA